MTEVGTNGRKARWAAPGSCSGMEDTAVPIGLGPTRLDDDLVANPQHLEAAALVRAFTAGNDRLARSQPAINAAAAEMVSRYHAARERIDSISRFRAVGAAAEACAENARVMRRHAGDGPEDRRRRWMPREVLWVVLAISVVFDAAFVGSLMQQIFDVDAHDWQYYLAYLPGIGIAVCLYAAGASLAIHLFRRRERLGRRTVVPRLTPLVVVRRTLWDWREKPATREPQDLPWSRLPGPLLFTAGVLALLGVVALVRAQYAARDFGALSAFQPAFVVLFMLLSIGAVGVKVLSYNPYADSRDEARRLVRRAERRSRDLMTAAHDAVAAHAKAWDALQSTMSAAKLAARGVVEEACAVMLDTRAHRRSGGADRFELPLVWLSWPSADGGPPRSDTELPGLDLHLLVYAERASDRHRPEELDGELRAVGAALTAQFGPARDGIEVARKP